MNIHWKHAFFGIWTMFSSLSLNAYLTPSSHLLLYLNTFTHRQYMEQHGRHKQCIEQHISLIRKSADRAPFLRVIPWHLSYKWGKSTDKPQTFKYLQDVSSTYKHLQGVLLHIWIYTGHFIRDISISGHFVKRVDITRYSCISSVVAPT